MNEYERFIRECMKRTAVSGLSQYKLAEMMGVSQALVNKALNGSCRLSKRAAIKMAECLGIDLGAFDIEVYR